MTKINYKELLTPYFIQENSITDKTEFIIEEINARELLVPRRIDLMAKWIYIDFRERGLQSEYGKDIYKHHLAAFSMGSFKEPGSPEKSSLNKYLSDFNALIDDIKENGFDNTQSLVPVGDDNTILDGAHRVAVSAYFNQPIRVIRFKNITRDYGYEFFQKRGLEQQYLDDLVVQYCKLQANTYALCLWPQAYAVDQFKAAEKIIHKKKVVVVAKKPVTVNHDGMKNLLLQIYGHHPWVGNFQNGFKGTERKVDEVHAPNNTVLVYILQSETIDEILAVKNSVRTQYNIKNSSIHITDSQSETLQVANILFNKNSLHFINNAKIERHKMTHKLISEFKAGLIGHSESPDNYLIDSSSILSIYGVRPANDLDYLSTSSKQIMFDNNFIEPHESELRYYTAHKDDLVHNPTNHFFFSDIKFASLDHVLDMKKARNEPKDIDDVRLTYRTVGKARRFNIDILLIHAKTTTRRSVARAKISTIQSLDRIGLKRPLVQLRNKLRK